MAFIHRTVSSSNHAFDELQLVLRASAAGLIWWRKIGVSYTDLRDLCSLISSSPSWQKRCLCGGVISIHGITNP